MYRLQLWYYPNQANPARAGGRGQYRVIDSYAIPAGYGIQKIAVVEHLGPDIHRRSLYIMADRQYKVGSRVDPKKIALAVLRA